MDGDRPLVTEFGQRPKKRAHSDFLLDAEDSDHDVEELNVKRPYKEVAGPAAEVSGGFDKLTDFLTAEEPETSNKRQDFGHCGEAPGLDGVEPFEFLPPYHIYAPQDGWKERGGEEAGTEVNWPHSISTAEGGIGQPTQSSLTEYWEYLDDEHLVAESFITGPHPSIASPVTSWANPVTSTCSSDTAVGFPIVMDMPTTSETSATSSASKSLRFTLGKSDCLGLDPINAAAYLHLLGESLSLIGHQLLETDKMVRRSSCLSLLLDSVLCALAPLTCLTSQVPELRSCLQYTMADTLENIAYVMPGL